MVTRITVNGASFNVDQTLGLQPLDKTMMFDELTKRTWPILSALVFSASKPGQSGTRGRA